MTKFQILKEYEVNLMKIQDQLSDGITNNIEFDNFCYKVFGHDKYLGTMSSDKMPKYIKEEQCFILNTEPSNKSGMHWVSFYKRNKRLYAYDSFSRPVTSLSKFWKFKKIISANKDRDQSILSSECESRAICWLISFCYHGPKIINII